MIQNGSFENCSSTPETFDCNQHGGAPNCSNVPYWNSQFYWVANWKSLCTVDWFYDASSYLDVPTTLSEPGTNDYCDGSLSISIDAQDGTRYAGLFNHEAIYYDFGSNLDKGYYRITFWVNSCREQYRVRVCGSGGEIEKTDEDCDLKVANNDKLHNLHQQLLVGRQGWEKITVDFNTFGKSIRYLSITGDIHGNNCSGSANDYFFVDNVYMEDLGCCPEYQLYQNTGIASSVTERRNYIRAGSDVGAGGSTGPVNIANNANVVFRAGNYITLEPVFNTNLAESFVAEIKPCENNTESSEINVPFIPNAYTPNGDASHELWCFSAFNATYYIIDVVDRWGALHRFEDEIANDGEICLDIDVDDLCEALWLENETGPTYTTYIYLYGCGEDYTNVINVTALCPPTSRKHDNTTTDVIPHNVQVHPNPFASELTLLFKGVYEQDDEAEILIINLNGQVVMQQTANPYQENHVLTTKDLAQGLYFVKVSIENQWFNFKVAKK